MESLDESIRKAVDLRLPGRTVLEVKDQGEWLRRLVEVALDGNEKVFFKISIHIGERGHVPLETGLGGQRFFYEQGFPVPRILAVDDSCTIFKHPYVIEEYVGGTRLGTLLDQVSDAEAKEIFETIGRLFRRIHSIHSKRSGIWLDGDPEKVVGSPNDYMFRREIVEGSGKKASEQGRVPLKTYYRAIALWATNMDYLNDHQPTLVHGSPLPWSIYLNKEDDRWRVTKLTALGVQWWDSAVDIAYLRYLPFGHVSPELWQAFLRGYGPAPEKKRILLYALMIRFMAAMGAFVEPKTESNKAWAETCLLDLDPFMDDIEKEA